jgi:hypothetical protein
MHLYVCNLLSAPEMREQQCMVLLGESLWREGKRRVEFPGVGVAGERARRTGDDVEGVAQGKHPEPQYEP